MARTSKAAKPTWPYPSQVVMTAHASGQWCKKIRGKIHYFGRWDDQDAALALYQAIGPDLHAGRTPRQVAGNITNAVLVRDVANAFVEAKTDALDADAIGSNTWRDYKHITDFVVQHLLKTRRVVDLGPRDFADLRAAAAKHYGPHTVGKLVVITRMIFRHAYDTDLITEPMRFGDAFRKPGRKQIRKVRARAGRQVFERDECRDIIHGVITSARRSHHLYAMILLGINLGFGQSDCSGLALDHVRLNDRRGPVIDFPRPKTGEPRTGPLWPITAAALQRVIAERQSPRASVIADVGFGGPVFVTNHGYTYCRDRVSRVGGVIDKTSRSDMITPDFDRLRRLIGLKDAPAFYGLRHTFRTIADAAGDQHAIHRIMGHALPGMSDVYVEDISVDRCRKVANHVHDWLFDGWAVTLA